MLYKLKENRVWRSYKGGKRIDKFFGNDSGSDSYFPEDWTASTVKAINPGRDSIIEGLAVTTGGEYLIDIINRCPEKMLGHKQIKKHGANMSILVKLLDSAERLPIQAHPTVEFAKKYLNSNYGKTECWYIIDADADAHVYFGFKKGITKEKWIDCFKKQDINTMLTMLHKIDVKNGDCIFVDGGMPHAIGRGCMMVELQEPTDLMVIPERITPSGINLSDVKLHNGLGFEKMFDCFDYTGYRRDELLHKYKIEPSYKDASLKVIVGYDNTDKFSMEEIIVNNEYELPLDNKYAIAIILDGEGVIIGANQQEEVIRSDRMFISADEIKIRLKSNSQPMRILITKP